MAVTTVVFDWYATLATPRPDDFWTNLPKLLADAGGRPDLDAIVQWERGHPVEHQEHSFSEAAYRSWQRRRVSEVAAAAGLHGTALEAFLDGVDDARYSRLFDVFPDVASALAALKADGLTVALCSNWDWCLDRQLAHNALGDLLDVVVCSAIEGLRKPHPAIFQRVLDRAGAEPAETLFVGDSWHDDVEGARAVGLTPVHIVRTGRCGAADHDGVACVSGLDEVRGLCR